MIERLELKNFRSHRQTTLELGRLTALVGPNGSGKTGVLTALQVLSMNAAFDPKANEKLGRGPLAPKEMIRRGCQEAEILIHAADEAGPFEDILTVNDSSFSWPTPLHLRPTAEWVRTPEQHQNALKSLLYPSILLRLSPESLAAPSYSDELNPTVGEDGSHLATVLAVLKNADEDRFQQILELTRQVVPKLETVRIKRARVHRMEQRVITYEGKSVTFDEPREMVGEELTLDVGGVSDVASHAASEGTLIALGIITVLLGPERPRLVLLDDIERGLHPLAQRHLVEVIRKIQDLPGNEDLQVVFTTHSPYVVDEMEPEDVWVLALDDEGATVARRLSEHPDVGQGSSILSTGELWSALGEEWVLQNA